MFDLLNDLTLEFVWLIHNFELKIIDLKFRLLPTIGTTVATGLNDWLEFSITITENSIGYAAAIGKSKDDVIALIIGEWNKYNVDPATSLPELTQIFDYVNSIGLK